MLSHDHNFGSAKNLPATQLLSKGLKEVTWKKKSILSGGTVDSNDHYVRVRQWEHRVGQTFLSDLCYWTTLKGSPKFPNVLATWKAPHHDVHVSQVVFQLSSLIIPVILSVTSTVWLFYSFLLCDLAFDWQ